MKLVLLRALALVGVVGLLTGGYVLVGFLEARWDVDSRLAVAHAERDTLAARLASARADSVELVAAIQRERARLAEACRMLPLMDHDSCVQTVDTRIDRKARRR